MSCWGQTSDAAKKDEIVEMCFSKKDTGASVKKALLDKFGGEPEETRVWVLYASNPYKVLVDNKVLFYFFGA